MKKNWLIVWILLALCVTMVLPVNWVSLVGGNPSPTPHDVALYDDTGGTNCEENVLDFLEAQGLIDYMSYSNIGDLIDDLDVYDVVWLAIIDSTDLDAGGPPTYREELVSYVDDGGKLVATVGPTEAAELLDGDLKDVFGVESIADGELSGDPEDLDSVWFGAHEITATAPTEFKGNELEWWAAFEAKATATVIGWFGIRQGPGPVFVEYAGIILNSYGDGEALLIGNSMDDDGDWADDYKEDAMKEIVKRGILFLGGNLDDTGILHVIHIEGCTITNPPEVKAVKEFYVEVYEDGDTDVVDRGVTDYRTSGEVKITLAAGPYDVRSFPMESEYYYPSDYVDVTITAGATLTKKIEVGNLHVRVSDATAAGPVVYTRIWKSFTRDQDLWVFYADAEQGSDQDIEFEFKIKNAGANDIDDLDVYIEGFDYEDDAGYFIEVCNMTLDGDSGDWNVDTVNWMWGGPENAFQYDYEKYIQNIFDGVTFDAGDIVTVDGTLTIPAGTTAGVYEGDITFYGQDMVYKETPWGSWYYNLRKEICIRILVGDVPFLLVTEVNLPDRIPQGGSVPCSATITNIGKAATHEPFEFWHAGTNYTLPYLRLAVQPTGLRPAIEDIELGGVPAGNYTRGGGGQGKGKSGEHSSDEGDEKPPRAYDVWFDRVLDPDESVVVTFNLVAWEEVFVGFEYILQQCFRTRWMWPPSMTATTTATDIDDNCNGLLDTTGWKFGFLHNPWQSSGSWSDGPRGRWSEDLYAYESTAGDTHTYWDYCFSYANTSYEIHKVYVGVEGYAAGNDDMGVRVSWDAGTSWSSWQTVDLPSSDPDAPTWLEFTAATSWTWTKLSNIRVRVNYTQVDGVADTIYLDSIPVMVTTNATVHVGTITWWDGTTYNVIVSDQYKADSDERRVGYDTLYIDFNDNDDFTDDASELDYFYHPWSCMRGYPLNREEEFAYDGVCEVGYPKINGISPDGNSVAIFGSRPFGWTGWVMHKVRVYRGLPPGLRPYSGVAWLRTSFVSGPATLTITEDTVILNVKTLIQLYTAQFQIVSKTTEWYGAIKYECYSPEFGSLMVTTYANWAKATGPNAFFEGVLPNS